MDRSWEAALQAMEEATERLCSLEPDDWAGLEDALEERGRALARWQDLPGPVDPVVLERLRGCWWQGAEAAQRFRLAREGLRVAWNALEQEAQLARSLEQSLPPSVKRLDCLG
jgi:hypothetical protein